MPVMVPVSTPEWAIVGVSVALLVVLLIFLVSRRRRSKEVAGKTGEPGAEKIAAAMPAGLGVGLRKTRTQFLARLQEALTGSGDADRRLNEIEEVLLSADVGVKATQALVQSLRPRMRDLGSADALRDALREQMRQTLAAAPVDDVPERPHVILVAGVNGVGKTTTIAKLAKRYIDSGYKVLLVAADTFRAAAAEQLQTWAQRIGADCVRQQSGSDPSAVAFDGAAAAVARGVDIVIVDTAGRLHVKQHLVEELRKVARTLGRQISNAPHEVLLVIDATTGQNALGQAKVFQEALTLTGIVLTKLDGTAKGGAVFAIKSELGIPIRYVGTGERVEDMAPFDPQEFVDALFEADSAPAASSSS